MVNPPRSCIRLIPFVPSLLEPVSTIPINLLLYASAADSIDVLFESTADVYKERAIAVILTGASEDGSQGLAKVKAFGGLTIVQEPSTAISSKMPASAIAAVNSAKILTLREIAPFLVHLCSFSSILSSPSG